MKYVKKINIENFTKQLLLLEPNQTINFAADCDINSDNPDISDVANSYGAKCLYTFNAKILIISKYDGGHVCAFDMNLSGCEQDIEGFLNFTDGFVFVIKEKTTSNSYRRNTQ